ncbi:BPIB3 protein, partial [Rhinopomastus cyanomelas]|nr:BPIB3 protein [Rhinopomastus cyanomelas]
KMSPVWAVFLLCSLLTPSQGRLITPVHIQEDVAEGAVGGLLGGDGVLGGLLGGDGVLGGLLDRDGVLGGVLGKDGLLDALLDDTGPRILNNTLPKISLRSLPGFGHQVGFNTQLLVEDTSVSGRGLCVLVEADVNMLVQDKWASLQSNKDCKVVDINIRLRPQVPLLDQPLKSRLSDILSEVGCDILNARLNVVSSLLSSGTPTLPLGALGDLPPFSILSEDSVQLDLNLLSEDKQGNAVAPTQAPPLPATLLLATGQPPQLSLSQQSLSTLLEPAQGAFNLNITSAMAGHDVNFQGQPFKGSFALTPLPMQLARVLPGNLPLELRVSLAKEPLVSVRDRRATVTLKASIDVVSPALQSAQKPLFSLDTDIVLNIIPSVFNGKLRTSLALDSINLTRAPLSLGPLSVSPLTEWLRQILTVAYIPAVNDALVRVSVPLPNVLSTNLRNAQVDIADVRI